MNLFQSLNQRFAVTPAILPRQRQRFEAAAEVVEDPTAPITPAAAMDAAEVAPGAEAAAVAPGRRVAAPSNVPTGHPPEREAPAAPSAPSQPAAPISAPATPVARPTMAKTAIMEPTPADPARRRMEGASRPPHADAASTSETDGPRPAPPAPEPDQRVQSRPAIVPASVAMAHPARSSARPQRAHSPGSESVLRSAPSPVRRDMPLDPTPPAPAIEIHIGRIEVQAQRPPAVATAPARPVAGPAPAGGRGLVDYLGWKVRGRGR